MTLPKLYTGRDRTFWLFNYEGLRSRNPSTLRAAIPTQTQLSGDLSGTAAAVTDPLTKIPFPNKQIPVTRFDPTSVKYMQFIPVTEAPLGSAGAGLNYLVSGSAISNFDQITTRIDHSFNSSNNIFVRYTMNDAVSGALTISPYSGTSNHSRQQSAVLAYNLVIRPNLINEFRVGFARHNAHIPPNSGDTSGPKLAETPRSPQPAEPFDPFGERAAVRRHVGIHERGRWRTHHPEGQHVFLCRQPLLGAAQTQLEIRRRYSPPVARHAQHRLDRRDLQLSRQLSARSRWAIFSWEFHKRRPASRRRDRTA